MGEILPIDELLAIKQRGVEEKRTKLETQSAIKL